MRVCSNGKVLLYVLRSSIHPGLARSRAHYNNDRGASDSHGLAGLGLYKFDVLGLEQLQHFVNLLRRSAKSNRQTLQHSHDD